MKVQVFKKLDEFLFLQMDSIRNNPQYKMILTKLESLPDDAQKAINYGVSLLLISIPIVALLFIFIGNLSLKSELSTKNEIKSIITTINNQKSSIKSLGADIIAPFPLMNKSDLDRRLSTAVRTFGLSPSKLQGVKLDVQRETGGIIQSLALVRVSDVSSTFRT